MHSDELANEDDVLKYNLPGNKKVQPYTQRGKQTHKHTYKHIVHCLKNL